MERVLLDRVIHTDYGQFDLIWTDHGVGFDGDDHRFFAGQCNGLVGAGDPNGVYVNLARRSGGSPVRIELLDAPPTRADESWEDVVEVSVVIPERSPLRWCSWAGESWNAERRDAGGNHRVRVSARGRDEAAADEFSDIPLDAYLIQLWPASPEPDRILGTTSADAEYWHREWGSRR